MPLINQITVSIACCLFLTACFNQADRDDSGQLVSEGSLDIFSLQVGDCTNDADSGITEEAELLNDVLAVPCSELHDNEFYAAFDLVDEVFPGDDAITDYAHTVCEQEFQPFVGVGYTDSMLEISYVYPSAESWGDGDREVICFLYHIDFEKLQGSMQGAKI